MTLKSKFVKSFISANIIQITLKIFQFISKLVLARILIPEDFGLFASSISIIYILQELNTLGISSNLVREKHKYFGNGFIIQLFLSFAIIILVQIFGGLFTKIDPGLPGILRIFVFVLIPNTISRLVTVYFNKELLIQKLIVPGIIFNACNLVLSIILAFSGFGVWSLIAAYMVSQVVQAVILWFKLKKHTSLKITLKYSRVIFTGSIFLFIINLVGMISGNINNLIINSVLTAKQVGYYSMAFSFVTLLFFFESGFHTIIYPAFVKVKDDFERTAFLYKYMTLAVTFFEVILFMSLINNIDWLFPILFDMKKWAPTIPIIKWLSIFAITNPFGVFSIAILQAHKNDKFLLIVQIFLVGMQCTIGYFLISYYQHTIAIVWSSIIIAVMSIGTSYKIIRIIGFRYVFFKEYIYNILMAGCFTILYYTTNSPVYRISGSIIIVGSIVAVFYKITFKEKFKLIVDAIKNK